VSKQNDCKRVMVNDVQQMGEIILVTAMDASGTWEGQRSTGERGTFPFTYIQFIDESDDAGH